MTTDKIASIVIAVVESQVHDAHSARGGEVPTVLAESRLGKDLGLDCLDTLEIIGQLECHFNRDFPDDDINGHSTVADLVALVNGRMG